MSSVLYLNLGIQNACILQFFQVYRAHKLSLHFCSKTVHLLTTTFKNVDQSQAKLRLLYMGSSCEPKISTFVLVAIDNIFFNKRSGTCAILTVPYRAKYVCVCAFQNNLIIFLEDKILYRKNICSCGVRYGKVYKMFHQHRVTQKKINCGLTVVSHPSVYIYIIN